MFTFFAVKLLREGVREVFHVTLGGGARPRNRHGSVFQPHRDLSPLLYPSSSLSSFGMTTWPFSPTLILLFISAVIHITPTYTLDFILIERRERRGESCVTAPRRKKI